MDPQKHAQREHVLTGKLPGYLINNIFKID